MNLTRHDIGSEIISILTRGMYPGPRDAVREYIQNAVDAKATKVEVKVRQNSAVIEDNGIGMDYPVLRNALKLGISDKVPGRDVGFMGIGLYSSFHLCERLTIYTRKAANQPLKLEINFAGMRNLLLEQKKERIRDHLAGDGLIDLQTLLEKHIELTENLPLDDYPVEGGTRVELLGLDPILGDFLSNFNDLSNYLKDVVPLHFDQTGLEWAEEIETRILDTCNKLNAQFDVVDLALQVQSESANLYRPYTDADFDNNDPQQPRFKEIKKDGALIGIAWGCLNSTRKRIVNKEMRGFLLKKKGF